MNKRIVVPLSGTDLVEIGRIVEDLESRLNVLGDGESGSSDLMTGVNDAVVYVERPDDPTEIVGEVRFHGDGWWGFYPYPVDGAL